MMTTIPRAMNIPPPTTAPIPSGPCIEARIPSPFIRHPMMTIMKPRDLKKSFISKKYIKKLRGVSGDNINLHFKRYENNKAPQYV
jgi:hypothetical protein